MRAAFTQEIGELYPGWDPTVGPPAQARHFSPPAGAFVVAYGGDGEPVACGGLKRLDDRAAEIKRLFVASAARGMGLGRALLQRLEGLAGERGYSIVRLDTGDRQPRALELFRTAGYREVEDYNGNPFASYWFEKRLGS